MSFTITMPLSNFFAPNLTRPGCFTSTELSQVGLELGNQKFIFRGRLKTDYVNDSALVSVDLFIPLEEHLDIALSILRSLKIELLTSTMSPEVGGTGLLDKNVIMES